MQELNAEWPLKDFGKRLLHTLIPVTSKKQDLSTSLHSGENGRTSGRWRGSNILCSCLDFLQREGLGLCACANTHVYLQGGVCMYASPGVLGVAPETTWGVCGSTNVYLINKIEKNVTQVTRSFSKKKTLTAQKSVLMHEEPFYPIPRGYLGSGPWSSIFSSYDSKKVS